MVAHISACHQEEKTFVCPEENCGQSFAHKACFVIFALSIFTKFLHIGNFRFFI